MIESTDTVIIGAGAAGLSAANALHKKKRDVIILEARGRIGGRVWTLHPESLSVPVELGAEFIHGPAEEVMEIAEREKLATVDIAEHRWTNEGGRLHRLEKFWPRLNRVMGKLEKRTPDRSFADALARNRSINAKDRALAIQFIEGFDAGTLTTSARARLRATRLPRRLGESTASAEW